MTPKTFGDFVREKREEMGLNQAEFAKKCGLSPSIISYYESLNRHPRFSYLKKILRATKTDANVIFDLI